MAPILIEISRKLLILIDRLNRSGQMDDAQDDIDALFTLLKEAGHWVKATAESEVIIVDNGERIFVYARQPLDFVAVCIANLGQVYIEALGYRDNVCIRQPPSTETFDI